MSKSKYDNDYKKEVIENGTLSVVSKLKKELYIKSCNKSINDNGEVFYYIENSILHDWLEYASQVPTLDCSLRLLNSRKRKTNKAHSKIDKLVKNGHAVFITLTFTDEVLKKTSFETRRRYVARFLKSSCIKYVANVDYGSKNGREHYHAITDNSIVLDGWRKYGSIDVEKIRPTETSAVKTARYINKLTCHAFKIKGSNIPRLIYSRNTF